MPKARTRPSPHHRALTSDRRLISRGRFPADGGNPQRGGSGWGLANVHTLHRPGQDIVRLCGRPAPRMLTKSKGAPCGAPCWGERWDSNPRSPGPQPGALNHSATLTTCGHYTTPGAPRQVKSCVVPVPEHAPGKACASNSFVLHYRHNTPAVFVMRVKF